MTVMRKVTEKVQRLQGLSQGLPPSIQVIVRITEDEVLVL